MIHKRNYNKHFKGIIKNIYSVPLVKSRGGCKKYNVLKNSPELKKNSQHCKIYHVFSSGYK